MLCGQRVRPPWLLLLLTLVCNGSFPKKKSKKNTGSFSPTVWSCHRTSHAARCFGNPPVSHSCGLYRVGSFPHLAPGDRQAKGSSGGPWALFAGRRCCRDF